MDGVFLGLAGCFEGFPSGFALGNPSEQSYQPSENPVHPSPFTWINPIYLGADGGNCDMATAMAEVFQMGDK